jgi:hypothetical protein
VRRAQDRGVQRSRPNAEVVDEAAIAGQQRGVFNTRNRLANPRASRIALGYCWARCMQHPKNILPITP